MDSQPGFPVRRCSGAWTERKIFLGVLLCRPENALENGLRRLVLPRCQNSASGINGRGDFQRLSAEFLRLMERLTNTAMKAIPSRFAPRLRARRSGKSYVAVHILPASCAEVRKAGCADAGGNPLPPEKAAVCYRVQIVRKLTLAIWKAVKIMPETQLCRAWTKTAPAGLRRTRSLRMDWRALDAFRPALAKTQRRLAPRVS